jgi:phage terminase large subunit GpA-like protein
VIWPYQAGNKKSRRTVLEKNLFQTARRHGAGKILRLFTFQGESRILKKTSFHRDKNKACRGIMLWQAGTTL